MIFDEEIIHQIILDNGYLSYKIDNYINISNFLNGIEDILVIMIRNDEDILIPFLVHLKDYKSSLRNKNISILLIS